MNEGNRFLTLFIILFLVMNLCTGLYMLEECPESKYAEEREVPVGLSTGKSSTVGRVPES